MDIRHIIPGCDGGQEVLIKVSGSGFLEDSFLSHSENFKRTLLSVYDGVYMTDRERRIVFWNPACERITGYTAGEVLGRKCSDDILNHVDMNGNSLCDSSLCPLHQSMEKGVPGESPVVVRARRSDGTRVAAEVSVAPLFGDDGVVIGGVEVFRDITEKQKLAEIKSRFLSGVTHELKNPLTIMQGFIELVLSGDTGEINQLQREFLDSALEEGDRFKRILDDLLDFARYEATEYSFVLRDVDLSSLLLQVAGSCSAEASRKQLAVSASIPGGILVFGDGHRLHQAFANLMSNALKYTEKGTVDIAAGISDSRAVVVVRDTGIGIPVEEQERIFDQFYRVDNYLSLNVGGAGIGLSIVKKIIERHGGSVSVRSQPGAGSEFTVTLPLKA